MEQFLQAETLVFELLLIVSLVALAVRRLRIPYTVALVVAGLIITTQSPFEIDLTPELILTLFVPPLVFEAAFHLNLTELRRNFARIFTLAVPGVFPTKLIFDSVMAGGKSSSRAGARRCSPETGSPRLAGLSSSPGAGVAGRFAAVGGKTPGGPRGETRMEVQVSLPELPM